MRNLKEEEWLRRKVDRCILVEASRRMNLRYSSLWVGGNPQLLNR
jgi:hypothetical protein